MAPKQDELPADIPTGRIAQVKAAYKLARRGDKQLPLWVFGSAFAVLALFIGLGFLIDPGWVMWALAPALSFMTAAIIFSRRVERSVYSQMEGRLGAAATVVDQIKDYSVTQGVAYNRQKDLVHRAVGPGGIVLLGEGDEARCRELMRIERQRAERLVAGIPVTEFCYPHDPSAKTLPTLIKSVKKLPKNVTKTEAREAERRLRAMSAKAAPPIPKGPLPKGAKPRVR